MLLPLLAPSALANPIATPFDYTFEIAFVNFSINGFILLFLYLSMVSLGFEPLPASPRMSFALFFMSVWIITFSGAIIDSMAFSVMNPVVYVVALVLIMFICTFVSHRYLGIPLRQAFFIGFVFLAVNTIMWTALTEQLIWISWDYRGVFYILDIAFILTLALVSGKYHSLRPIWRHDTVTWEDGTTTRFIGNPNPGNNRILELLLLESFIISIVLFVLVIGGLALYL
jgi:hypothetical protein